MWPLPPIAATKLRREAAASHHGASNADHPVTKNPASAALRISVFRGQEKASLAPRTKRRSSIGNVSSVTSCQETAFIAFTTERQLQIRAQLRAKTSTKRISKLVSEAWKSLPTGMPFKRETPPHDVATRPDDDAETTKSNANKRIQATTPAKRKNDEDSRPPKRPMTAFVAFAKDQRATMKQALPFARCFDITQTLARVWKVAPRDFRESYFKEARKRQNAYLVAMEKWQNKADDKLGQTEDGHHHESVSSETGVVEDANGESSRSDIPFTSNNRDDDGSNTNIDEVNASFPASDEKSTACPSSSECRGDAAAPLHNGSPVSSNRTNEIDQPDIAKQHLLLPHDHAAITRLKADSSSHYYYEKRIQHDIDRDPPVFFVSPISNLNLPSLMKTPRSSGTNPRKQVQHHSDKSLPSNCDEPTFDSRSSEYLFFPSPFSNNQLL